MAAAYGLTGLADFDNDKGEIEGVRRRDWFAKAGRA